MADDLTTTASDDALPPVNKPGLDLFANIDLNISGLRKAVETKNLNDCRKEQSRFAAQPDVVTLTGTVTLTTAANPQVVDIGSPSQGRQWDVRALASLGTGQDIIDPATGSGAVTGWYVGPLPPRGIPVTGPAVSAQLRWYQNGKAGAPTTDKVGPHQIIVRAGEHLYAVVTNTTGVAASGLIWISSATVADEPVKNARAVVET